VIGRLSVRLGCARVSDPAHCPTAQRSPLSTLKPGGFGYIELETATRSFPRQGQETRAERGPDGGKRVRPRSGERSYMLRFEKTYQCAII
jgi:hypothetical protein